MNLKKAAAAESTRDLIALIDTVDFLVGVAGVPPGKGAAARDLSAILDEYSGEDEPLDPLWEIAKILGVVLKGVDIRAVVSTGRPEWSGDQPGP
ncbi:MAG TPA: hypothetical protein VFA32_14630, partial [Dehalococcoidia bacterium]|nr:hypothetical protein [Dehalococcoidia bacterium]